MVFFNYSTMQMAAKVVYYGPGLCGKTTNLHYIYTHTSGDSRGEMVSLETETDRTLFFDLLPIDVGQIAGFRTRIQLYTVPGQVFYNTTRKLVLKGVDGVVFVADSQRAMLEANVSSFSNLSENLAEMGLDLHGLPLVLQYNKRDLPEVASVEEMNQAINRNGWSFFTASAISGEGVFETLKGISKLTLMSLKQRLAQQEPAPRPAKVSPAGASAPSPPVAAPAPPPVPSAQAAPAGGAFAAAAGSAVIPPAAMPAPAAPAATLTPARALSSHDILRELEQIRRQTLRPPAPPARPVARAAGQQELTQDLQLSLQRALFDRVRRLTVNVQVEDAGHAVLEAIRDLKIDIADPAQLHRLLLKLNLSIKAE